MSIEPRRLNFPLRLEFMPNREYHTMISIILRGQSQIDSKARRIKASQDMQRDHTEEGVELQLISRHDDNHIVSPSLRQPSATTKACPLDEEEVTGVKAGQ